VAWEVEFTDEFRDWWNASPRNNRMMWRSPFGNPFDRGREDEKFVPIAKEGSI